MRKAIVSIVLVVGILAAGASALYWWQSVSGFWGGGVPVKEAGQLYQEASDAYKELWTVSPAFAQAARLQNVKEYAQAAQKYREALASVQDPAQEGVVKFWLASSLEVGGGYAEAVAVLKSVVADEEKFSAMTRAYAVQRLAHMYHRYNDPLITKEIFKDEPYKSLFVQGRTLRSYRNLFDYATKLYPLALSELYVADWYAERVAYASSSAPTYMDIIRERLALAEQDLERVRNEPSQKYTFLNALERRAVLLAKVEQAGEPPLGDTEGAFREVIDLFAANNLPNDVTARFQYALYLAKKYGNVRAADIRALLAPLNEDLSAHSVSWGTFIKNERARAAQPNPNLLLLASIDPGFKKLLLSLGWKESDFK